VSTKTALQRKYKGISHKEEGKKQFKK
jgi:hypothetical protein